jgi:hypothetical protein
LHGTILDGTNVCQGSDWECQRDRGGVGHSSVVLVSLSSSRGLDCTRWSNPGPRFPVSMNHMRGGPLKSHPRCWLWWLCQSLGRCSRWIWQGNETPGTYGYQSPDHDERHVVTECVVEITVNNVGVLLLSGQIWVQCGIGSRTGGRFWIDQSLTPGPLMACLSIV